MQYTVISNLQLHFYSVHCSLVTSDNANTVKAEINWQSKSCFTSHTKVERGTPISRSPLVRIRQQGGACPGACARDGRRRREPHTLRDPLRNSGTHPSRLRSPSARISRASSRAGIPGLDVRAVRSDRECRADAVSCGQHRCRGLAPHRREGIRRQDRLLEPKVRFVVEAQGSLVLSHGAIVDLEHNGCRVRRATA